MVFRVRCNLTFHQGGLFSRVRKVDIALASTGYKVVSSALGVNNCPVLGPSLEFGPTFSAISSCLRQPFREWLQMSQRVARDTAPSVAVFGRASSLATLLPNQATLTGLSFGSGVLRSRASSGPVFRVPLSLKRLCFGVLKTFPLCYSAY